MRSERSRALVLPLLVGATVLACAPATGPSRAPAVEMAAPPSFPSPAELDQIAAAPAPAKLFDDKAKDVPRWDLRGPLPDAMDDRLHEDSSSWGKLLDDAAAARPGALVKTEAMHCVAREGALFYLENDALPAEPLQRFIAARCGAPSSHLSTGVQGLKYDERMPMAQVEEAIRTPAKAMAKGLLDAGEQLAGIAFVQKKGKAAVALVAQPRQVRVDAVPLVPAAGGKVTVRGEVVGQTASVRGVVNRGRYGFAKCTVDLSVPLPRFSLDCPALPEDEAAWIEVAAFAPGRVLGASVLEMLVWPSGKPGGTYARLAEGKGSKGAGDAVPATDMVEALNRVRKEAGLPAVSLAPAESATAQRLVPHYFGALLGGGSEQTADLIALGLRAGWQVEGTVRNGTFVSTWVRGANDGGDVVSAALSRPFGREALLDPSVVKVAIGTARDPKDGVQASLISAYALFDGYRHEGDAIKVVQRLTALRAARGLPPPLVMPEVVDAAMRAAQAVQAGHEEPGRALQQLLDAASARIGQTAHGWVAETSSLDEMTLPEALLRRPTLPIAVGVAHRKVQGQPWARFVVYLVTTGLDGTNTAKAGGPLPG